MGGSNNSGRVLQVRLLEAGAWRLRGCSRLVRDVGGNAENPGRNQGELRSWEEAGNPGRNKEKQTRVRRKLNKNAEPNITLIRQKVYRCSMLRLYHSNGQYVSAPSSGSGGLL